MDADPADAALTRIEAALSRLEGLAERQPLDNPAPDLAARHERLRGEVGDALRRIDALLARHGTE